uniref:Uncharacterized protein n=1 Tax=Anguilla anguilla TaxID=7936 RepID=A0A0E9Q212_ANGAN
MNVNEIPLVEGGTYGGKSLPRGWTTLQACSPFRPSSVP